LIAACGTTGIAVERNVSADAGSEKIADSAHSNAATIQDERFEQIYNLNLNGKIQASNINGSIKVTTWDSPQVRLVAVKSADNPEDLKYVQVKVESTDSLFSVKAEYPNSDRRKEENWKNLGDVKVEFELTVPRTANLAGITTVNGDVTVDGTAGTTNATTVNGSVKATNLGGAAKLTTVNGTVEADFDSLVSGSNIKLSTVNGTVNLMLPSDADATIKASSLSGSITNDFGLPVRKGDYVGRDMYGRLGNGDISIKLSSVSGSLAVNRKNDGRSVNPATNLLNMKDEDNDQDY
jgi:DUF4097 and DUF4098 domain-containing protein YvlB